MKKETKITRGYETVTPEKAQKVNDIRAVVKFPRKK